jgi:hypothetical protein
MKRIIAFASIALMAAVLGVNVYNSVVDARSWGADIPESIRTARAYFAVVNPGTFFRVASPVNQILALAALVACWRSGGRARLCFGLALVFAVVVDGLTFSFFYPRNAILFGAAAGGGGGGETNVDALATAWSQWRSMNWVRSFIIACGLVCSMKGLDFVYRESKPAPPSHP